MSESKGPANRTKTGRETTQFKPGQSGNPSGRPKIPDDVKQMFREATPRACEVLCQIINDEGARYSDRIKAAEVIMDRAWGKAVQAVDVDAKNIPQVVIVGGDNVPD